MLNIFGTFSLLLFVLNSSISIPIEVFNYVNENLPNGYHFGYKLSDSQERQEWGEYVTKENTKTFKVNGFYSYIFNGKRLKVNYESDEKGYRAKTTLQKDMQPSLQAFVVTETLRIAPSLLASLSGGGIG
ncbi:hypothetical protein ABEB36_010390 [Hypothenemus hampei]|uniref:Uncharacterized protein n=1 Tax=Hypothenemus hampei TaxID=57062 RepID=A0ABD1ELN1_HYPHA